MDIFYGKGTHSDFVTKYQIEYYNRHSFGTCPLCLTYSINNFRKEWIELVRKVVYTVWSDTSVHFAKKAFEEELDNELKNSNHMCQTCSRNINLYKKGVKAYAFHTKKNPIDIAYKQIAHSSAGVNAWGKFYDNNEEQILTYCQAIIAC